MIAFDRFQATLQLRRTGLSLAALLFCSATVLADSNWLYGIHWYGDPNGSTVETMTGGKGIWSLEIVVTYSDPWWQASGQQYKFQQIVARGHTIICRIEPNWGSAIPLPGEDLNQYIADVQATAQTLAGQVHIWQIGNEMNLYGEWGGNVLDAATYINAFKQIRSAIKSVPSPLGEQIVLVGPVSPGAAIGGVRHTDGNTYIGQMCALLTAADFDGFALHAYGAPWLNEASARADMQAGYVSQLGVIDSAGFTDKPVYITEWNRRVEPINDANEAQSAQFLHGAFSDLHAWNQLPGAHEVTCACWFIFDDSPGWENYSIEHLKGIGPSGSDNDLWDAFQYACSLNLPAGVPTPDDEALMYDATPPGQNVAPQSISVSTSSNYDANNTGAKAIDQVISAGSKWTTANLPPPHWLQLDLDSVRNLSGMIVRHAGAGGETSIFNTESLQLEIAASAAGPWNIQALVANPAQANVSTRTYQATTPARHVRLFITDPGVDNYARIPEFEVYETIAGDTDADGDVDEGDIAVLTDCTGGPLVTSAPVDCDDAMFTVLDIDGDGAVTLADYGAVQQSAGN